MEAIRYLNGLGGSLRGGSGILTAAITAHHHNVWVLPHPPCRGVGLTVREQIDRAVALQVDKDGSEPLTASECEIVYAKVEH